MYGGTFSTYINTIGGNVSTFGQFFESSGGYINTVNGLNGGLADLNSVLGHVTLEGVVVNVVASIGRKFSGLTRCSDRTGTSLSTLGSKLARLGGDFTATFTPVLAIMAPTLSGLVDLLSHTLACVNGLFTTLANTAAFIGTGRIRRSCTRSLNGADTTTGRTGQRLTNFSSLGMLASDSSSDNNKNKNIASPSSVFRRMPVRSDVMSFVNGVGRTFETNSCTNVNRVVKGNVGSTFRGMGSVVG